MRLLLDTHALLWYVLGELHLSKPAQALIRNPTHEILISAASYWGIAIKVSLGKLSLKQPYDDFIKVCSSRYSFNLLAIEPRHTTRLIDMPFHHRDPFDRLLVAQALVDNLAIVSSDADLDGYGVIRLW